MDSQAEVLSVGPRDHVVLFYRDDTELIRKVGQYLLEAVQQGGTAVVVGSWSHGLALARFLVRAGIDLGAARANGAYAELDAGETLERFVFSGHADAASFWSEITPIIRRAAGHGRPVRLFGEMVSQLWDAGLAGTAIEVEAMWNEIATQFPFSLVCAYSIGSVTGDGNRDPLTEVCRAHSAVVGEPPASMRGWRY